MIDSDSGNMKLTIILFLGLMVIIPHIEASRNARQSSPMNIFNDLRHSVQRTMEGFMGRIVGRPNRRPFPPPPPPRHFPNNNIPRPLHHLQQRPRPGPPPGPIYKSTTLVHESTTPSSGFAVIHLPRKPSSTQNSISDNHLREQQQFPPTFQHTTVDHFGTFPHNLGVATHQRLRQPIPQNDFHSQKPKFNPHDLNNKNQFQHPPTFIPQTQPHTHNSHLPVNQVSLPHSPVHETQQGPHFNVPSLNSANFNADFVPENILSGTPEVLFTPDVYQDEIQNSIPRERQLHETSEKEIHNILLEQQNQIELSKQDPWQPTFGKRHDTQSSRSPENLIESGINSEITDREHKEKESEVRSYEFGYGILHPDSGNRYYHAEKLDEGTKKGSYKIQLPDGRIQTVQYTADSTGYHPKITYEGKAQYPHSQPEKRGT